MRALGRGRAAVAAATVLAVVATLIGVTVRAQADTAPTDCDRADAVMAWRDGGPQVRQAAEQALLGSDAEVCAFLATGWAQRSKVDVRLSVNQMMANSGPAVRDAAQLALDSTDPAALDSFMLSGWRQPAQIDQRLRINQMMAVGGAQVRTAAQRALDAGTAAALQTFVDTGWRQPYTNDQRIRVNQILAAGGPQVRVAAQRALDAATVEAFNRFLDRDWAVAAARDQETQTITDLLYAAQAAGAQATAESQAAKDEADRAVAEAAAAKQAAQVAANATEQAHNDAVAAAAAAGRAAEAADRAAAAAQQAVSAARAASSAARVAANAAARAAMAASRTGQAAARAYQAAVAATTDASKASQARTAAQAARDIALTAKKIADAAAVAAVAARQAGVAATSAASAGTNAEASAQAAAQAGNFAAEAGADASVARAAAARASANAGRARRAAQASVTFANIAAGAAEDARDAATRAVAAANTAAAAADDAAAHAGQAAGAAARATAHANAATQAAQAAVTAATQARTLYEASRAAEAQRLQIQFEQDDAAARAAANAMLDLQNQIGWDAAQAAKRSAETNRQIAEATDAATPRATAVSDARKVALALSSSDGSWTRTAALEALAGSEDEVLAFVRTGIAAAAGADDRAALAGLMVTGSAAMRTSAEAAMAGTDADVTAFVRTRTYSGRDTEDRLAVNQLLSAARTAGDQVTVQQAQRALDAGTGQAFRRFLETDQYLASAADQRVKVNQVLADPNSGSELKAAAQIALDGPPVFLSRFLSGGRHAAAGRDQDSATHAAVIAALLAQAAQVATLAVKTANEAQSAAATARGAATEAHGYADQALAAAADAAGYATQASQSAAAAQDAANRAAASASTAVSASAAADASAAEASRSASWARASADSAAESAVEASAAADAASVAAVAAGADAAAAALAAAAAFNEVKTRWAGFVATQVLKLEQQCDAPGIDPQTCRDQLMDLYLSPGRSVRLAYMRSDLCNVLYQSGSPPYKACLNDVLNPAFKMNQALIAAEPFVIQMVAFGEAMAMAAATTAGILGARACPQCAKAALDLAMTIRQFYGIGLKDLPSARMAAAYEQSLVEAAADTASLDKLVEAMKTCSLNSFTAGTPVLLADGTSKPIQYIRIGDRVLSTDPVTATTEAEPVTATITGAGAKHLVDVTVDTDGPAGSATGKITATDGHPFWVAGPGKWVVAGHLRVGQWLRTGNGTWVQVARIRHYTEPAVVHNLTVARHHTYYVLAGKTPVLVHNAGSACGIWTATANKTSAQNAYRHYKDHHADFPDVQNALQYVQKATDWLHNPPPEADFCFRPNGDFVVFDETTDYFGVMTKDGVPRTFYKPNPAVHGEPTNLDYFKKQCPH